MGNKNKIFISFATQERDLAVNLRQLLLKASQNLVGVFVSDVNITAGELWEGEIKENISQAEVMLVLCSPQSVQRPWVNFECGAAALRKIPIFALCHSGLRASELPAGVAWENNKIDVHQPDFIKTLVEKIGGCLVDIPFDASKIGDSDRKEFETIITKMVQRIDLREAKKSQTYQRVSLRWKSGAIEITKGDDIEIKVPTDESALKEEEWRKKIMRMRAFLADPDNNPICWVGLAIGIQNCLVEGDNIYVGARMKSIADAYSSAVGVAKGEFNTGYELLRSGHKLQSIDLLQDLFAVMPQYSKYLVATASPSNVYDRIKSRIEGHGGRLWPVRFDDGRVGLATIFINPSRWFPRFEIGIWKYVDVPLNKLNDNTNNGRIGGFGVDLFLDYLGRDNVEDTPINYWIWVKDGKICYWSYPEERLIPRYKPVTPPEKPQHAVLLTARYMNNFYGHPACCTPFAADNLLSTPAENVLKERFSLPARALLSCF